MTRKQDRRSLGRGLSALLGDVEETAVPVADDASAGDPDAVPVAEGLQTLAVDLIDPNPAQPRRDFAETELAELAASIRERGVIQPVIVRPAPDRPGRFQIVAGERRWRAAQRAQMHDLPAVVRSLDDRAVLELAIIENVQRTDLNPLEEATGYAQLIEKFAYTQEALARIIGKSRSHLANTLRLLQAHERVRELLREGKLSAGHARALINAPDPEALARQVVAKGLTVRQTEQLARKAGASPKQPARPKAREKDADTRMLEGDLSAAIGMSVRIEHAGADGGGELRIRYRSLEDLDRLCQSLSG